MVPILRSGRAYYGKVQDMREAHLSSIVCTACLTMGVFVVDAISLYFATVSVNNV